MLTSGDALTGGGAAASKPPKIAPLPMPSSSDPLLNLSLLNQKLNSLRHFLSSSIIAGNPSSLPSDAQIQLVSSELSSAVHQIILNGAALLSSSTASVDPTPPPAASKPSDPSDATPAIDPIRPQVSRKAPDLVDPEGPTSGVAPDDSVVEIDAAELVAEHVHFCEVCGKGFKRDANLRMHMRAHGDQFKTLSALRSSPASPSPPPVAAGGNLRFSCPVSGCTRNRTHKKFRPLKSAVCVKNHFKRSHCPKMYACERCDKSFSVMADLRSHLKVCGESCRWRCSCGTRFSRKDKLFGHVGLFEGHVPVVVEEGGEEGVGPEFFEGLMEEIGGVFGR